MARGLEVTATYKVQGVRDLPKLMEEWPERTRGLRAQLLYLATERVFQDVMSKIPTSGLHRSYRDGLEIGRVMGLSADEDAYAIYVDVKKSKVRKVDGPKTVLYIQAKRRSRRTPPEIAVLESFNPWTIDTLPIAPDKRWAVIVSRKASKTVVSKVAKQRRRDAGKWKRALSKVGVRQIKKDQGLKVNRKVKAMPDVALDAIRMEFGLGATKSTPHWRPAILQLVKGRIFKQLIKQDKRLKRAFLDSGFQQWKKWPKKIRRKLRMGEVRKYKGFQKKLGIRAQR